MRVPHIALAFATLSFATVSALAAVPLARAQETATTSSSDVHDLLQAAVSEYDGGNYQEAYALFMRIHQLQPSARSERALGKASFELRRYGECVRWLEASLADERSPLTDEMRTEVNGLLARARAFVGRFEVHATAGGTAIEGVRVDVDGAPVEGTTLQLDLGEHDIVSHAEGYSDASRHVSVHGGENETMELTMVATGATAATPAGDTLMRDLGWASIVAGGVFAIGGAVATALWANALNNLNANVASGACYADPTTESLIAYPSTGTIPAICLAQQNTYRTALPIMYAGFIAGGALLAAGLALVLVSPSGSSESAAQTRVTCSPFADVGASCQLQF